MERFIISSDIVIKGRGTRAPSTVLPRNGATPRKFPASRNLVHENAVTYRRCATRLCSPTVQPDSISQMNVVERSTARSSSTALYVPKPLNSDGKKRRD